MSTVSRLPGFRFHPTEVELVQFYLKRKIMGRPFPKVISEIDIYEFAPWDLPDKSLLQSRDSEWYFFCQRHKKYPSGRRMKRSNEFGHWKSTGNDKTVCQNSKTVGKKKILVFQNSRAPRGDKTTWVMHEFRLDEKDLNDKFFLQNEYVLCRLCKKSGPSQENGEEYGDSFDEDGWDDDILKSLGFLPVADPGPQPILPANNLNILPATSPCIPGSSSGSLLESIPFQIASSDTSGKIPLFPEEDIALLLEIFGNNKSSSSISNNGNMEKLDSVIFDDNTIEAPYFSVDHGIYNGLEDLDTQEELDMIDKFHFTSNLEAEYPLHGSLLGDDASCSESNKLDCPLRGDLLDMNAMQLDDLDLPLGYTTLELNAMKLDDLDCPLEYPIEANYSECFSFDNPSACYIDYRNFEGFCNPLLPLDADLPASGENSHLSMLSDESYIIEDQLAVFPKGNGIQRYPNFACKTDTCNFTAASSEKADVRGSECSSQFKERGEQDRASYLRLQCLLDSIPAKPASAAMYPSPTNGENKSKSSCLLSCYGSSSIHVKAEVTINCSCTKDALSGKLGEFPCMCCSGRNLPRKEFGKQAATCGGKSGFKFVFLLVLFTALVWLVLIAMSAKLLRYTWKLILS